MWFIASHLSGFSYVSPQIWTLKTEAHLQGGGGNVRQPHKKTTQFFHPRPPFNPEPRHCLVLGDIGLCERKKEGAVEARKEWRKRRRKGERGRKRGRKAGRERMWYDLTICSQNYLPQAKTFIITICPPELESWLHSFSPRFPKIWKITLRLVSL